MAKDCTTCGNLRSKSDVKIIDQNTEKTVFVWYCSKNRQEFKDAVTEASNGRAVSNFSCPEYIQRQSPVTHG